MKLSFVENGCGNNFISIKNGTCAEEFLKEYNIEYVDHGDHLRIDEEAIAYVPINTLDELHFFTEKYYSTIHVMGGNYCIEFHSVHEDDLRTAPCVWDYLNTSLDELLSLREGIENDADGLPTQEQEDKLIVLNRAINYVMRDC